MKGKGEKAFINLVGGGVGEEMALEKKTGLLIKEEGRVKLAAIHQQQRPSLCLQQERK